MRKVKAAEVGRGLVQAKGQRASGFIPLRVDTGFPLGRREPAVPASWSTARHCQSTESASRSRKRARPAGAVMATRRRDSSQESWARSTGLLRSLYVGFSTAPRLQGAIQCHRARLRKGNGRRAPHSACPVLHSSAGRKPVDSALVCADHPTHWAARVAPDVSKQPTLGQLSAGVSLRRSKPSAQQGQPLRHGERGPRDVSKGAESDW